MRLRIFAPLCIFFALAYFAIPAEQLKRMGEVKEWHFDSATGKVEARLSSYGTTARPSETVLTFETEEHKSQFTVHELAPLLSSVLKEMPSLGYDPGRLLRVNVWLQDLQLQAEVSKAVEQSGTMRSCIKHKYCREAQPVADRYLNSVSAFKEFGQALQANGLQITTIVTDDMSCGRKNESGGVNHAPARVSCSGLVLVSLRRTDGQR